MTLTVSLVKADLIAASQAIEHYKEHKLKEIKNVAAYHLQQAAEKMIKLQIYAKAEKINYASLYTHNIEKLIAYAESLGVDIAIPKHVSDNSLVLTGWEAGSRYDIGFHIRIDSLEKMLHVMQQWFEEIVKMKL